jgi:predicted nucleic acid-binding protein
VARGVQRAARGDLRGRRALTFIDTNVLVYSAASGAPFQDRARAALAAHAAGGPLSVSRQILREYLAVMTRQQLWGKALVLGEALADTSVFLRRFTLFEDGPPVWEKLVELSRQHSFAGRQIHDANVVATMRAHGERRLLTFNDADFRRFAAVIEVIVP